MYARAVWRISYGFMPGFMRVPWDSPGALSMTMVHVGPLTATARDAALAYAVMAPNQPGHFHTEIYGGHGPPVPHLAGYSGDPSSLRGLRVGVYRPHMEDAPEHLVAAADATLAYLTQQGAIVGGPAASWVWSGSSRVHLCTCAVGLCVLCVSRWYPS